MSNQTGITQDQKSESGLKKGLKSRHVSMIAIGGAIGTGLFVALGGSLHKAGPGGMLLAYALVGVMVYFLMTSLGELSTYMPVSGSMETYASKFVDPAMGFALGWNYWYNGAITVACEIEASILVVKYWIPDLSILAQVLITLGVIALLFTLNFISVKSYGEGEFWFAGIKVVTILAFLAIGILQIVGIMGGKSPGFSNWTLEDAPFPTGIAGVLSIFLIAGFSFQGTELIGVAAGEMENPAKQVPKAIKTVFLRIMVFYLGAILVIAFLLPYNDPNLLGADIGENVSASPFAIILSRAFGGTTIAAAIVASVMNAIILTSILSCGNSFMYASSRMLYSMAKEGKAPKIFGKLNKRDIPVAGLIFTTLIAMAAFFGSLFGASEVYMWLVGGSSIAGFIAWLGVAISHFKFRKAFIAQGHKLSELKYKAILYPFGPIFALLLCLFIIVGQFWTEGVSSVPQFLMTFAGGIAVILLYIIFKIVKKTKWIKPEEADLSQGLASK